MTVGEEGLFGEGCCGDVGEKVSPEEEADSADVDGAVVGEEFGVGGEVGGLGEDFVNLDDVGLALAEDVGLDGAEALAGEDGVAEKAEVDDVDVVGVEHDGAHVGCGVGEDGVMGEPLETGEDGSGYGDAIDGDARHVDGSLF